MSYDKTFNLDRRCFVIISWCGKGELDLWWWSDNADVDDDDDNVLFSCTVRLLHGRCRWIVSDHPRPHDIAGCQWIINGRRGWALTGRQPLLTGPPTSLFHRPPISCPRLASLLPSTQVVQKRHTKYITRKKFGFLWYLVSLRFWIIDAALEKRISYWFAVTEDFWSQEVDWGGRIKFLL